MEAQRQTQGKGVGSFETQSSPQGSLDAQEDLRAMESRRAEWRPLCMVEQHSKDSELDEKTYDLDFPPLPMVSEDTCETRSRKRGALSLLEIASIDNKEQDLWFTVDSGASENVISPGCAPSVRTRPSAGSREGVCYVTANGMVMQNYGEKDLRVLTEEGHKCRLTMQVTDVSKPLMSVSRICDAGHKVVFESGGGYIEHVESGQVTRFQRVDNVYRLKTRLSDAGFARQAHGKVQSPPSCP